MKLSLIIASATFALAALPATAASKTPSYKGSIELRIPTWNSKSGYVDDVATGEIAGSVKVYDLLGPFVLTLNGEHTFRQAGVFKPEQKLKVGLEYPITKGVCLFSYYDLRPNENVERVFVGIRQNFGGKL